MSRASDRRRRLDGSTRRAAPASTSCSPSEERPAPRPAAPVAAAPALRRAGAPPRFAVARPLRAGRPPGARLRRARRRWCSRCCAVRRVAAAAGAAAAAAGRARRRRAGRGGRPATTGAPDGRAARRGQPLGAPPGLGRDRRRSGSPRRSLPRLGELVDERLRQRHGITRRPTRTAPGRCSASRSGRSCTTPAAPHPVAARPRGDRRRTGEDLMNDVRPEHRPPPRSGRLARAVLDAVGTVVVGKRDALELVLAGILAGGHVLLEDLPGPGQDADRPVASPRRSGWTSAGCSSPPTCCPPTSPARSSTTSARTTSPSGPARSSPTCCSPTRSTARRRRPRPRCWRRCRRSRSRSRASTYRLDAAVPRARHRQPDRVRGHVPAARGAARPVPAAGLVRLPGRRRGVGRAAPPDGPPPGGGRARAGGRRGDAAAPCRPALEDVDGRGLDRPVHRRADRGHPGAPAGAGRRLAARLAGAAAAVPGAARRMAGRDYVVPEDVKEVAVPALAHRITLRPEMWLRRVDPAFVVGEVLDATPGAGQRRAAQLRRPAGRRAADDADRPCRRAEPEPRTGRRLGAHPGARPGGAAHRPAAGRRRCCSAGSTWSCSPRRSRSAPRSRCAAGPRPLPRAADRPRSRRSWSRAATLGATRRASATRTRSATTWRWCALRALAAGCGWTARRPARTRSTARRAGDAATEVDLRRPARCAGAGTRSARPAPAVAAATGCWSAGPVVTEPAAACGCTR